MKTYLNTLVLPPILLAMGASCSAPEGASEWGEPARDDTETSSAALRAGDTDYTPTDPSNIVVQRGTARPDEAPKHLIDGTASAPNTSTKYWMEPTSGWIRYRTSRPTIIRSYDISSSNLPSRAPRNWTFSGSIDGYTWVELDRRNDEAFSAMSTRTFPVCTVRSTDLSTCATFNSTPYIFYKLDVSEEWDDHDLELSGFRVGGTVPSGTPPTAVGKPAVTLSGTTATITWTPVSGATGYYVQRIGDDGVSLVQSTVSGGSVSSYTDATLAPGTPYLYQIQAFNGTVRALPSPVSTRVVTAAAASGLQDYTALSNAAPTSNKSAGNEREVIQNITDNTPYTKFYTPNTPSTTDPIQLEQTTASATDLKHYIMVAANDEPVRDPRDWKLFGITSSGTEVELDSRVNQTFGTRYQQRVFTRTKNTGQSFTRYRLSVTKNNGSGDFQIAEWRLFGNPVGTLLAPTAPTIAQPALRSPTQVKISWTDNSGKQNPEASFAIDAATSSSFSSGVVTTTTGPGSKEAVVWNLSPNTTYYFRVRAINAAGSSTSSTVSATTLPFTGAPSQFRESQWYNDAKTRMLYKRPGSTANVAFYVDELVPDQAAADWLIPIMDEAFVYAKATYGAPADSLLYTVANHYDPTDSDYGPWAGAVQAMDERHGFRNIAFAMNGSWQWNDQSPDDWLIEAPLHELGHILESINNRVDGSPSNAVWGDDRWADFLHWDLFTHMTTLPPNFLDRQLNRLLNVMKDDNGVAWFRDLLYPLYNGSLGNLRSGSSVMVRYYQLLAQNLPQIDGRYGHDDYGTKQLNLGEFIHFLSGAAGVDLEAKGVTSIFLWTPEVELQYLNAQQAYPAVLALYRAPDFVAPPTATGTAGVPLSGQTLAGQAKDPNGDAVTFEPVTVPSWLTVSSNGALTGTPPSAGVVTAIVKVRDATGLSNNATLTLTIQGTSCTPETDATFCTRLGASCGSKTGTDNCGVTRAVASCGGCTSPQTCGGGGTPNVCGGGSGGTNPCANLCSNPAPFAKYQNINFGAQAACYEATIDLQGMVCGNLASGGTVSVNGTVVNCSNVLLPAKRNSGYCVHSSAGNTNSAYFTTW